MTGGQEHPVEQEAVRALSVVERLAGIGHWEWDVAEDDVRWSERTCELYGVPADETPRTYAEFRAHVHPDDVPGLEADIAHALEVPGPFTFEHRAVRRDGEVRHLCVFGEVLLDESGHPLRLVGTTEDVTDRRATEAALVESERRFRQIADNTQYMFWLRDLATGRFLYVNPAYEQLFGGRVDDMYADPRAWLEAVHPDDRERAAGEPDGVFDEEYRIHGPGGDQRWVRARSFPVKDADGRVYRRAGIAEDVTDRKLLQEQLQQSQKMEAVGRLAGGIAHDFNNLLFVILNYVEEALADVPAGSAMADDLGRVVDAAERARSLTDQMLQFSRRQPAVPVDLDLNTSVRGVAGMLRRVLGEDVRVDLDLTERLPGVRLDPTQLQQVLLNLAVNSRDAMPGGGSLRLTTAPAALPVAVEVDEPVARSSRRAVALKVSDTGHGMPADVASRAFEPFFTTKPVGRGTGLGLSSVFGIVEAAGGVVGVDSAPGEGTTVTVLLPATDQQTGPDAAGASPVPHVDGGGRVALVVEDEDTVRRALVRQLRRAGFVVHEAGTGAEAVRACQYTLWQVDLLVTDLVMPGMSGYDLVDQLSLLGLDPPVVFVSGYPGDQRPEELRGPRRRFLQKPFRGQALMAVVEELSSGA